MPPQPPTDVTSTQLQEIKELYGSPPVLSTESADAYYKIMARYLEVWKPKEFIEMTFIPHLTNATWEIIRYMRYKSLMIESGYLREAQSLSQSRRPGMPDPLAHVLAAVNETLKQRGIAEEKEIVDVANDPGVTTQEKPANDLDYVRALQKDFEFHEQLDIALGGALKRLNVTLEQFERYRSGLGRQLGQLTAAFIIAQTEPEELETSMVPLVEQQP